MQTHEDNAQSGLFLAIHCFGKSSVSDNEVSLRQIGHSFPPHMFSLHKESLAQYLAWSSPCSQLSEPNESELLLEDQERPVCYEFHAIEHRVPWLLSSES